MVQTLAYSTRSILAWLRLSHGVHSAFALNGVSCWTDRHEGPDNEANYPSRNPTVGKDGDVEYVIGIKAKVNGTPGEDWHQIVAYTSSDLYDVFLTRVANDAERLQGLKRVVVSSTCDVYGENLHEVFVNQYDEAINARNGGFIPLG